MSSINNIITTTYRAIGAQALVQASRQVASGTGQLYNNLAQSSRMSERLNNQWRAIGTTMRYAIAGQAVFGLTQMIGQLKDVQVQMGLIQAIASQPATQGSLLGSPLSNKQIDQMGDRLRKVSQDAMTPLKDVNDAALQFYSTVQNAPPDTVSPMLETMAKAAKLSTTNMQDAVGAFTGLNIAFQRPNTPRSIGQVSQMWASMIGLVPGGPARGSEIIKQLGPVATQFMQAPGIGTTPRQAEAQLFTLLQATLRTNQTPSIAGRGLAYLLQAVATPRTPAQRKALASFGITPEVVHREGVYRALTTRLLPQIKYGGNVKALSNISEQDLEQMDAGGQGFAGLPAGQMTRLREAIGMIHGVRTAIILSSQLRQHGDVQSIPQVMQIMLGNMDQHTRDVLLLKNQWDRLQKQSPLQKAASALEIMRFEMAKGVEPILNFAADRALTPFARAAEDHRDITRGVTLAGVGLFSALGIRRFFRGGGAGAAFQTVGQAQAIHAAMRVGGQIGSSPLNPLYVTVVTNLSNPGGPLTPTGAPVNPGGGAINRARSFGTRFGPWAAALGRYGNRALPYVGVAAGAAAAGLTAAEIANMFGSEEKRPAGFQPVPRNLNRHALLRQIRETYGNRFGGPIQSVDPRGASMQNGVLTIHINIKHPDGTIDKREIHIRPTDWKNGNIPSRAGVPGGRR